MCVWKKLGELFSFTNNKNLLLALTSATCISMHNSLPDTPRTIAIAKNSAKNMRKE